MLECKRTHPASMILDRFFSTLTFRNLVFPGVRRWLVIIASGKAREVGQQDTVQRATQRVLSDFLENPLSLRLAHSKA